MNCGFSVKNLAAKRHKIKKTIRYKTSPITLCDIVSKTAILEYKNKLYFVHEGKSMQQYFIQKFIANSIKLSINNITTLLKLFDLIN